EVEHRHDHEHVEIVFAAERLLVPAHRALERIHGVAGAVFLAGLHIDAERDLAAGHGDEAVLDVAELAADQREQIGGLRPGIGPPAKWRPPGRSPLSFRLPLASSTGASDLPASMRVEKTAITSGRSG